MSHNLTVVEQIFLAPLCEGWNHQMEGSIYHLASLILMLGYMGGSGIFGSIYILGFLATGFFCYALWGWMDACGLDVFSWNVLLVVACLVQLAHLMYRLRKDTFQEEYDSLYKTLYQPLQVPLDVFKEIVKCSEDRVLSLVKDQNYAVEGKTPIDRLSLLISGRVRVSLDGQFLHYIFPFQFLDSAEWESLRPSEEGIFQVTLTAETDCRYISWPRKKLYHLLAKEHYIAQLFSVLLGFDISQKLYALNDKLFAKFGLRFDIRLPSLYHVLGPSPEAEAEKESSGSFEPLVFVPPPMPTIQKAVLLPHVPLSSAHGRASWPDSDALGEDSTSLVLEDFAELPGSFMDCMSEREYMK
uniref:Popeye domain-containing protein 2 isoform X1 n=1 Tax=Geotrypetes seraphini TaxID=260995 RepID=A0A6P8QIP0_GEOSA|nr:popeye domain-containing protein 2 isoform X1 [Geotrypetes seraphini]